MESCLSSWEDVNVLRPSSNRNLWASCEPVIPAMINKNTLANQSILDGSLQCSKYSSSQQYSDHSFRASSMKAQNACIDSVTLQPHDSSVTLQPHDSSATVDNVVLSSPAEQHVAEQQYHSLLLGDLGVLQLSKLERFGSIQRARSPCDFNQRKEQESYDIDGSTLCKPVGRLVMETCSGEGETIARSSKKEVSSVLRRLIRGETTCSKGSCAIKIPGPEKCRARARRGEATDLHSISERKRRIRITERMRALHKLVPDASKTNKASMLDEVIQYVSVLQTRLKRGCKRKLDPRASPSTNTSTAPFDSNSSSAAPGMQGQLGESAVVMPNVEQMQIDMQLLNGTAIMRKRRSSYIKRVLDPLEDTLAEAERQVTRLLDRDLSAALIYLAGRGLSLVPIRSLMQVNVNNSSSSNVSNNTLQ